MEVLVDAIALLVLLIDLPEDLGKLLLCLFLVKKHKNSSNFEFCKNDKIG